MKSMLLVSLVFLSSCDRKSEAEVETALEDPVFDDSAIMSETSDSDSTPAQSPERADPETVEQMDPIKASVHQYELNATSVSEAAYFRFENGALVPANGNELWHLAIRRTQFQTNSGSSGPLNVGAGLTETTDYATVTQCTGVALTYDATLPASGAPGSQPYSGNAALNGWYGYDVATHIVTSKKQVYLLSDGVFCYKFQILNYASGLYTVLADALDL